MSINENTARSDTLFGNYDIIETLGHGGMGVVYRAHDVSLDRVVAIKVLKDDLRAQQHVVARFQREAQALASLNHPNIIQVYSVGSIGRIPYMAMEFIEGEALNRRMHRERRLHWEKAFDIAIQVAEALANAHEAQIIHRDVKPGNIIIGAGGRAVVTDFGVAKILTAETQLTIDGSRLGTPQYMSPERCLNQAVTASSDIYSLGVLLFQMIAGRLPYKGKDPIDLIRKIVSEPPARLADFIDVPDDVQRLVAFMIEKKPEDRPASAQEVVELLTRVKNGEALFEEDSGFDSALEELRGELSTPTSGHEFYRTSSTTAAHRIRNLWRRTPKWSRTTALTSALMAVAAVVGTGLAGLLNADLATGAIGEIDSSVAHWYQPVEVATFIDESPGVILAQVKLADFEPHSAGWMGNSSGIVMLKGVDQSSRQNQTVLCAINPIMRNATLCLAPVSPDNGKPAIRLLGFSPGQPRTGSLNGSFLFSVNTPSTRSTFSNGAIMAASHDSSQPGKWSIHHAFATSRRILDGDLNPRRVDALAVSPDGETIVLAVSLEDGTDTWMLAEREARLRLTEPVYTPISGAGPEISHLEFSRDASILVYARELGNNHRSVWVADLSTAEKKSWLLAQGDIVLNDVAISPASDVLVASMPGRGGGQRQLKLIDLRSGEIRTALGEGRSATWHSSTDYVVSTARDLRGRLQLFTTDIAYPHKRTQLTYLEDGVTELCAVSFDGDWALSGARGTLLPTLVFARLPE